MEKELSSRERFLEVGVEERRDEDAWSESSGMGTPSPAEDDMLRKDMVMDRRGKVWDRQPEETRSCAR